MKRLSILTFCLICLVSALASSGVAEEKPVWTFVEKPPPTEPKFQMAIGVGHQIATEGDVQTTGLVRADLFYFPSTEIGLKFGILYNGNMTGDVSSIKNYGVEFGPRMQLKYRVLSPFVEALLDVRRYYGTTDIGDYSNTRGGLSFAGGMSVSMGKGSALDVSIRKVFNNPDVEAVYAAPTLPQPPDDPPFGIFGFGSEITNFYDPVSVEVQFRFKL